MFSDFFQKFKTIISKEKFFVYVSGLPVRFDLVQNRGTFSTKRNIRKENSRNLGTFKEDSLDRTIRILLFPRYLLFSHI